MLECLKLGRKRNDREVILVKICKNLLPTAKTLQKDSFFSVVGIREKMTYATLPSNVAKKGKIKSIETIQEQMKQLNTKYNLENKIFWRRLNGLK